MEPLQITDTETPDAPWLRGNTRVPGGMAGTIIDLMPAHERKAGLIVAGAKALRSIIAQMADTTAGRECRAYDEALVHAEHLLDQVQAAQRARTEALRLQAAE